MKQISILTLHFYDNYGSVLQAWALRAWLERQYGCQVDVAPFRPPLPEYRYFKREPLLNAYAERRARFERFREDQLGMTRPDGGAEILKGLGSDAYIAGSDIIWSREHSGLHPAYFLDFASPGKRRIAYAASMHLGPGDENELERLLPGFDAVSVREAANIPLISRYTRVPVQAAVDPTLLLTKESYISLAEEPEEGLPERPYLLSYCLTHDPALVDFTNVIAETLHLQVVHFFADYPGYVFPKDAGCFAFCGPQEFLSYVQNAALVFTNSFHGTVFSILMERPFYTCTMARSMLSRVLGLTEALGLQDRCFTGLPSLKKVTLEQDVKAPVSRLAELRSRSEAFLTGALEGL